VCGEAADLVSQLLQLLGRLGQALDLRGEAGRAGAASGMSRLDGPVRALDRFGQFLIEPRTEPAECLVDVLPGRPRRFSTLLRTSISACSFSRRRCRARRTFAGSKRSVTIWGTTSTVTLNSPVTQ
jgi:hypothetical protein